MSAQCAPLSALTHVHNTFIHVKIDQFDDVDTGLRRSASAPELLTPPQVKKVEPVDYSSEPAVTATVTAAAHLQPQHPDQEEVEESACPRTALHSAAMPFVPAKADIVPAKAAKPGVLALDLSQALCEAPAAHEAPPLFAGRDRIDPAMAWHSSHHNKTDPLVSILSCHHNKKKQQHQQLQTTAPDPGGKQGNITTVIMHNVPYSMNRDRLVELLEWGGFKGQYDFLYLPIDFSSKNTKGYCFVNLTDPGHMERFYDVFDGFGDWGCQFCQKRCRLQINRTQGWHLNVARYRKSALLDPSVPDEYKPAIFKDGVRIPLNQAAGRGALRR